MLLALFRSKEAVVRSIPVAFHPALVRPHGTFKNCANHHPRSPDADPIVYKTGTTKYCAGRANRVTLIYSH